MKTPVNTVLILIAYAASIWLIKRLMANRTAFEMRLVLIVYNAFQVLISLYIAVEVVSEHFSFILFRRNNYSYHLNHI